MSIIKVTPGDIESFTIVTNPLREYVSSSLGVTGSINIFPRRSPIEKEFGASPAFIDVSYEDSDVGSTLEDVKRAAQTAILASGSASYQSSVSRYMDVVNQRAMSARKQTTLDISRTTPGVNLTRNSVKKNIVKDILMPHYRTSYPRANWAYTNYNSLNFFSASTVNPGVALLYPNVAGLAAYAQPGHVSGAYALSGAFSFDFYINPRYTSDSSRGVFHAGTILHMSSCYAVSLVTGSSKDQNGYPDAFRIKLQLSHSADVRPQTATQGTYPNDLIFLSDDNSLLRNSWHHVVIRWGTSDVNNGTGSFNIDGVDTGTFVVPSGTLSPKTYSSRHDPALLVIGNFYEGTNSGSAAQSLFFSTNSATRDGTVQLTSSTEDEPASYTFRTPLNAELHDVCIKRYYMSDTDIEESASLGMAALADNVAFYLPPFFTEESPFRQRVDDYGGILQTPFFEINGTTDDPFNVAMAFGVDGHYINIENYLRDFANDNDPRVHLLTASAIAHTTTARSANEFLYDQQAVRMRNLLILPCDDGNFSPAYELLDDEVLQSKMVDDVGAYDRSLVNLSNMLLTSSFVFGTTFELSDDITAASDFVDEAIGFSPEQPGIEPGSAYVNFKNHVNRLIASGTYDAGVQAGAPLTIYQRTRDPSSNQITMFDISNLYYGLRIKPGTMVLTDSALTGSSGKVGITLRDDGRGNIYRADSETDHARWSSVGNIFYDEGVIVIKNPHLYFFGKHQFEITFNGEQNIHSMKLEVIAPQNMLNSSSNPSFMDIDATGRITDTDKKFVYITDINFHDADMNVVMRTTLAQPIVKRHGSRILFKTALDF